MTETMQAPDQGAHQFVSQRDEMSLTDERAAQTDTSVPDTLEVREDSLAIVQDTVGNLRKPVLITIAIIGAGVVLAATVSALLRRRASVQAP